MKTKFQNKANLLEAGSSKLEAFLPIKPIYPVNPVNPVKKPNEPNLKVAHASVLEAKSASALGGFLNFDFCSLLFNMILPNEPKTSFFN